MPYKLNIIQSARIDIGIDKSILLIEYVLIVLVYIVFKFLESTIDKFIILLYLLSFLIVKLIESKLFDIIIPENCLPSMVIV